MSFKSPLAHCSSLQVGSSLDALADVLTWFNQLGIESVDPSLCIEAQTALVEGFTNVVQHAHADLPDSTPVNIEIQMDRPALQIKIWDQGQPYDFEGAMGHLSNASDIDLHPLNRERHWGQILFLKLARDRGWRFTYDRQLDHRNCLLIEKSLESS